MAATSIYSHSLVDHRAARMGTGLFASNSNEEIILIKNPQLAEIQFQRVIGNGAYGLIMLCSHAGRSYAVKIQVFQPPLPGRESSVTREIKVLKTLNSRDFPIPRLYGMTFLHGSKLQPHLPPEVWTANADIKLPDGTVDPGIFHPELKYALLFMEYIAGENLLQISKYRPLDNDSLYNIAEWIFNVLTELHRLGIVHRDVKSDNVIMTPGGELYLIDYGFACSVSDEKMMCRRHRDGTPQYLAPELFTPYFEVRDYPAADVWAAGVMLYELTNRQIIKSGPPVIYDGNFPWELTPEIIAKYNNHMGRLVQEYSHILLEEEMIPSRYVPSVSEAIYMALIKDPQLRSTAKEIYAYLKSHPSAIRSLSRGFAAMGNDWN